MVIETQMSHSYLEKKKIYWRRYDCYAAGRVCKICFHAIPNIILLYDIIIVCIIISHSMTKIIRLIIKIIIYDHVKIYFIIYILIHDIIIASLVSFFSFYYSNENITSDFKNLDSHVAKLDFGLRVLF